MLVKRTDTGVHMYIVVPHKCDESLTYTVVMLWEKDNTDNLVL